MNYRVQALLLSFSNADLLNKYLERLVVIDCAAGMEECDSPACAEWVSVLKFHDLFAARVAVWIKEIRSQPELKDYPTCVHCSDVRVEDESSRSQIGLQGEAER